MSDEPEKTGRPNRRAHPRAPVLVCETRCIAGIEVFFGQAQDISRGGMFIVTHKMRTPGSVYEIQFRLAGVERVFRCRARVAWVRPYRHRSPLPPGFGVEFVDLPEPDRCAVDGWVHEVEATG